MMLTSINECNEHFIRMKSFRQEAGRGKKPNAKPNDSERL